MSLAEGDFQALIVELVQCEYQRLAQQLREQHEALLAKLSGCPLPADSDLNPQRWLLKQSEQPCKPHAKRDCGAPLMKGCIAGTPCIPEKTLPPEALEITPVIKSEASNVSQVSVSTSKLLRLRSTVLDVEVVHDDHWNEGDDDDVDAVDNVGDVEDDLDGGDDAGDEFGNDSQNAKVGFKERSPQKKSMSSKSMYKSDKSIVPPKNVTMMLAPEPPKHPNHFFEFLLWLQWRMQYIASSTSFEITFASLIMFNAVLMATRIQYNGFITGWKVHHGSAVDYQSSFMEGLFFYTELVLGFVFFFEFVFNITAFGIRVYFRSAWSWLDGFTVLVWLMDFFSFLQVGVNPMILRIVRLARLLKMLRLVRTVRAFDTLHLLVYSIRSGVATLVWSAGVLMLVKMCAAMLFSQMLQAFILDSEHPLEIRQQVWSRFGTFLRALVTMFEITLANWVPPCRLLMDHVSIWYAFFFMFYKLSVGFAVVNVIGAVFIQQTMKVAATDENILIRQKEQQQRKWHAKLKRVFSQMDRLGKGFITWEEFQEAIDNKRVRALLCAMEIDVREALDLFRLLDNGKGEVSWDEFSYGMERIRGTAQSVDMVTLLCLHQKESIWVSDALKELLDAVRELREFHV